MCIAFIAYKEHPHYPLIIAANRDEFYSRPTAAASYWHDYPGIVGGRDLKDHGTWFAALEDGRVGLLTNHRNFDLHKATPFSRGTLIVDYLSHTQSAQTFLNAILPESQKYNPFNLILLDANGLYHFDNVYDKITTLPSGIYGLSNAFLDTAWPKVILGKQMFKAIVSSSDQLSPEFFLPMLNDTEKAPDWALPNTGIERALELQLSSIKIETELYGTRAQTIFWVDETGKAMLYERSLRQEGDKNNWLETCLSFKVCLSK